MKPALTLLRELRRADAPVAEPQPDPEAYARTYDAFVGDCETLEDLRACDWFYCRLNPHLIDEIPNLQGECARLEREGASTDDYRAAVKRLAARIRDIRNLYRNRWAANPDRPATSEEPVVVIGEACLLCSGVEYWPIPVNGFFLCATCHEVSPTSQPLMKSRCTGAESTRSWTG